MLYWENDVRTPLRDSGRFEKGGKLSFPEFTCKDVRIVSGEGSSGLVYQGISDDYYGQSSQVSARVMIKECYPVDLAPWLTRKGDELAIEDKSKSVIEEAWNDKRSLFLEAFDSHAAIYQGALREQVTVPRGVFESNGTAYIVSDMSNGVVLSDAVKGMSANAQVIALMKICDIITSLHDEGFVYLDLKPSNVLVVRDADSEAPDSFTGDIRLFDFDTVTQIQVLKEGTAIVCGSGDWSSYEQTHPSSSGLVDVTSDIYSVGAMLFWMLIGRPPKSSEVIHANGEWRLTLEDVKTEAFQNLDNSLEPILNDLLCKTLTPDPTMRYASARALKRDLRRLSEHVAPIMKTMYEELKQHEQRIHDDLLRELSAGKLTFALESALSNLGAYSTQLSFAYGIERTDRSSGLASISTFSSGSARASHQSEALFPLGRERECPWADALTEPSQETIDLLSNGQRDMLAVLALAPEDGFLVDALLQLLGADTTSADFDAMRGAGYLSVDVAVRRCRLSECISRQVAYDNRASDAAIEKIDALLMDYALVSRENINETVFLLLDVAKMAYMLNHSMERRAFYCALCASYSCQVGRVDEVRTYLQEAAKMAKACSFETKNDEGIIHSLIGACYVDGLHEYDKALDHIEKSLVLLQEQDAVYSDVLLGTLAERMKAQASLGRWREACDTFVQCLDGRRWNTKDELVKLCLGTFVCYVPEARWTFNRSEVADMLRKSAAEEPPKEIRERFDQLMVVYAFHSTAYLKPEASMLSEEMSEIAHSILANQPKDLGDWGLVITGLSQVESDRDDLSHAINDLLVSLNDSSMGDDLCDLLESCVTIASSAGLYDEAIRCKRVLLSLEARCSDKESALSVVFDIDYACALLGSEGKEVAASYCRETIQAMESRLADDVGIQRKYLLAVEFLSRRLALDLADDIAADLNVTIEEIVAYIDGYRKATGNNADAPFKLGFESGISALDQQNLYGNLSSLISTASSFNAYEEPIAWLCTLLLREFSGFDPHLDLELYEYIIRYHARMEDWIEIILIADEVMSFVTDDSYSKALEKARIDASAAAAELGHSLPVDDIRFASVAMRPFMAVPIAVGQAFSKVGDEVSAAKAFLKATHIMNRVIDLGPSDDPMLRLLEAAGFNEIAGWTLEMAGDLPKRVSTLEAAKDYMEIAVWTFKHSDAVCGILWHPFQSAFCAVVDAAIKRVSDLLQSNAESD